MEYRLLSFYPKGNVGRGFQSGEPLFCGFFKWKIWRNVSLSRVSRINVIASI
jgi:hypothetical protein